MKLKRTLIVLAIAFAILVVVCVVQSVAQNAQYFNSMNPVSFAFKTGWNGFATALEHVESPLGIIAVVVLAAFAYAGKDI
jgi:hypothetical protein